MNRYLIISLFAILVGFCWSCKGEDEPTPIPEPEPVGAEWIDPFFARELKKRGYITDAANVTPSDVKAIELLNVGGSEEEWGGLKSLRGIEYFESLKQLNCAYNEIAELDLSKNSQLVRVGCSYNQLKSLDVSKNAQLDLLLCYCNQLTVLDVSKNPRLYYLDCEDNLLSTLDVRNNIPLKILYCGRNQLTSLDISKNTCLENLDCSKNQLVSLGIGKNTQLTSLYCSDNHLEMIDISKNLNLEHLVCYKNPGLNNVFEVVAWFDNNNIPDGFPRRGNGSATWYFNDEVVVLNYKKS